jgi:hypothetical protein
MLCPFCLLLLVCPYRVTATFTPYDQPKEIMIMNVIGDQLKMKCALTVRVRGNMIGGIHDKRS